MEVIIILGNCKWFNYKKGYGFIRGRDEEDIFVHYSNIAGGGYRFLKIGEAVEFDRIRVENGLQAINVVRLNPEILTKREVFQRFLGEDILCERYKPYSLRKLFQKNK